MQDAVEAAILGFSGERVRIAAAGRTDAGVHATHQVAHADLARDWPDDVVRDAVNAHLRKAKDAIVIVAAARVDAAFHARFSATGRRYLYRILNRRTGPALDRSRVWHVARPLDVAAMQAAAARLVGRHDFTTFRAAGCQANSPVKTLDRLDCARAGDEIRIEAAARSFLHHQVRSMVGSLAEVGLGRWTADDLADALAAHDRARCGPVAPACGLYLVGVDYDASATK